MTYAVLSILAGSLMAFSHWIEVLGFFMRVAGSKKGLSALGYSVHVQLATGSRLGTFLAFPMIGYCIDKKAESKIIILSLIAYCIVFFLLNAFSLVSNLQYFAEKAFIFIIKKINRIKVQDLMFEASDGFILSREHLNRLTITSSISYLIIVAGIFMTFTLSAIWHDYRATILQLGPIFTGIGTIISTTMFDPFASWIFDKFRDKDQAVLAIIHGRMYASVILLISSLGILYV